MYQSSQAAQITTQETPHNKVTAAIVPLSRSLKFA